MADRKLRCSECGVELKITTKATAQLSEKVIMLVSPHNCQEFKDLESLGITPDPVPAPVFGKFVQKLNDLNPTPTFDPGDRRSSDAVKTTEMPQGLANLVKQKGLGK